MNDTIIEGRPLRAHDEKCHACGGDAAMIIKITKITLPEGIKPGNTLIAFNHNKPHRQIGVTCGCYARFHRQVAHIQERIKK